MARQDLAECHAADLPRAGLRRAILEVAADAGLAHGPLSTLPSRAALVAETAPILAPVAEHVAEPRNVEPCRAIAEVVLAVQLLVDEEAFGADAKVMVHKIVAELAGARAQSLGPDVGSGLHQQPGAIQCRRADENDA